MIKIARGTTGQADFSGSPGRFPLSPRWSISNSTGQVATNLSPNGWSFAEDGTVTVPAEADSGEYDAIIYYDWNGSTSMESSYEFEVVCLKVTLRSYTRALP